MATPDQIREEWEAIDHELKSLVESSIGNLGDKEIESFANNLQSIFHRLMSSEIRKSGIEYLELFWKTLRDDIPTGMDKRTELNTVAGIARTLDVAGHWDEAFEKYEQAIDLAKATGEKEIHANLLRWKGHLHRKRGEWEQALECTRNSLDICRELNLMAGEAYAYNNLGTIHFELGRNEEARDYYEKALAIAQEEHEDRLMAQVNNNLGVMSQVVGDRERAIVAYHHALPCYEREGDIRGMAQTYYNLALSFEEKGDEGEIQKHLEKSVELAGEIGERNLLSMIYLRKALLSLNKSDGSTATHFVEMAKETFNDLGDQLGIADAFRIEGLIFAEADNFEESISAFGKSIEINRKMKSILGLAEVLLDYGRCLVKKGDPGGAKDSLEESRTLYSRLNDVKNTRLIEDLLGDMDTK